MIRSEAIPGVAFGTDEDGDARSDRSARQRISAELGISEEWATISQVHGPKVAVAVRAGHLGEADGILTDRRQLPLVVATADCLPVVIAGFPKLARIRSGSDRSFDPVCRKPVAGSVSQS